MIKLFRNIRKNLLNQGKTTKYFKYAIGEIFLVVIGILIALQLNTWNAQRIQQNEVEATYRNMLEEISSTREHIKLRRDLLENVILKNNKRSLYLMRLKNEDSIQQIYTSIKAVTNVLTILYDMPTTSAFLNDKNITSIENKKLKAVLLQVKRSIRYGDIVDSYANNQLNTIIEPYITKNLNYAQMVGGRDMIAINSTDTTIFFDNLELENLINLKIEIDNNKIDYLSGFETVLEVAAEEIQNELHNKT
jgi:hypothetical protein